MPSTVHTSLPPLSRAKVLGALAAMMLFSWSAQTRARPLDPLAYSNLGALVLAPGQYLLRTEGALPTLRDAQVDHVGAGVDALRIQPPGQQQLGLGRMFAGHFGIGVPAGGQVEPGPSHAQLRGGRAW